MVEMFPYIDISVIKAASIKNTQTNVKLVGDEAFLQELGWFYMARSVSQFIQVGMSTMCSSWVSRIVSIRELDKITIRAARSTILQRPVQERA